MSLKIGVQLDSFNKIYREGEYMTGVVELVSPTIINFEHITAVLTGQYLIKNNKLSPPLSHVIKFFQKSSVLAENGKIQPDKTNPFNLKLHLVGSEDNPLIETYQGVLVTISVSALI